MGILRWLYLNECGVFAAEKQESYYISRIHIP